MRDRSYCTTTLPVIPARQCGAQKYGKVPALVKVWLYVAPAPDVGAVAQLVSVGEQNLLSAVQLLPLVTV